MPCSRISTGPIVSFVFRASRPAAIAGEGAGRQVCHCRRLPERPLALTCFSSFTSSNPLSDSDGHRPSTVSFGGIGTRFSQAVEPIQKPDGHSGGVNQERLGAAAQQQDQHATGARAGLVTETSWVSRHWAITIVGIVIVLFGILIVLKEVGIILQT